MKAATIKELKEELNNLSSKELKELCLHLARFRKENKELLTYLLFESNDEEGFIENVKKEVDELFEQINKKNDYLIKKSLRKILRLIKRYARYSQKEETEVELLIYFCRGFLNFSTYVKSRPALKNLYNKQIENIRNRVKLLHEDLQFDFGTILDEMSNQMSDGDIISPL